MMRSRLVIMAVAALAASAIWVAGAAQPTNAWPAGWQTMEVEAKWNITPGLYDRLVRDFADEAEKFGYTLSVRWSGISRLFTDVYYDRRDEALARAQHSIRHRTRLTSSPRAPDNSEAALEAADWGQDWQVIQYKSTPCRIGAVWFRMEAGACRLSDADPNATLCAEGPVTGESVLGGDLPGHPAIQLLGRDHPTLQLSSLRPVLRVTDYRYRVEFQRDGDAVFEMSLDRVTTTQEADGASRRLHELELELIAVDRTADQLAELLRVADAIERDYTLVPSATSKGGIPVEACVAGG